MSEVTLVGYIIVPDNELETMLAELPNHIQLSRQEEGCILFKVNQSPDNKQRFDVMEIFTDRNSFEKHQERVQSSYWGQVTRNITRHYQIIEE
jgi:quinol monooxygenase YgiN